MLVPIGIILATTMLDIYFAKMQNSIFMFSSLLLQ